MIWYINEDLNTGLNDGTSEINAYQSWVSAMTAIDTLTEDSVIYFYSVGTVDIARVMNINLNGFNLEIEFKGGAIALNTTAFAACIRVDGSEAVGKVTIKNPNMVGGLNSYGIQMFGNTNVDVYNIQFIGSAAKRALYNGSTATLTIDGMVATGAEYAIGNTSTGTVNATNCYGNSSVSAYFDSGTGTLNLTTCASSDTTGSVGLQNIPYDITTFTNVTQGSEDFVLADGSSLIGVGTTTASLADIDGRLWGTPRDIGIKAYTTVAETITFSYNEINDGFSGFFNFVDDPNLRKFGKNASWFGIMKGSSASLKCGGVGTNPYLVYVDGALTTPTIVTGEIELFSGLSDSPHYVCIVVETGYAVNNNYMDTTEAAILSVTGSEAYIKNIPFEYASDPAFLGKNSYSTAVRPDLNLTPTYEEIAPWDYEVGQIVFKSTCDEIWIYTDNTSVIYSVDGGSFTETTFTEPNTDSTGTVRRAVMVSDSLDGNYRHTYRLWGGSGEEFGIQGVVCLLNGEIVSILSPGKMRKVMVLGSSVVEGSNGSLEGYADTWYVGNQLDYLMVKAGQAGSTSPETEADFSSIVSANGIPDVCIFGSSTNDTGDSGVIQAAYESLITAILAEGVPQVVCRGVVPYLQKQHDALVAAVTAINLSNVTFVSSLPWDTIDTSDGIHPTTNGYVQLAAYEIPDLDNEITIYYNVSGVTYDSSGSILEGCQVSLFRHYGNGVYEYIATQISANTTGVYDFTSIIDNEAYYMVMAHKADVPNVFDVTDNNLEPLIGGTNSDVYLRSQTNKTEPAGGRRSRAKYNGGAM